MNHIFEAEQNADLQQNMWTFHKNMMMMNQMMSLSPGLSDESTSPEPLSHGPGAVTGPAPS